MDLSSYIYVYMYTHLSLSLSPSLEGLNNVFTVLIYLEGFIVEKITCCTSVVAAIGGHRYGESGLLASDLNV